MRGEGSGLAAGEKGLGGKNIPSIPSPSRPEKGTGSEPPLLAMVLLLFGSETPFERMMKVMHPPPKKQSTQTFTTESQEVNEHLQAHPELKDPRPHHFGIREDLNQPQILQTKDI